MMAVVSGMRLVTSELVSRTEFTTEAEFSRVNPGRLWALLLVFPMPVSVMEVTPVRMPLGPLSRRSPPALVMVPATLVTALIFKTAPLMVLSPVPLR